MSRTDTERLDWFEKNPQNVLAHEFEDRTFGFYAREHQRHRWPDSAMTPWMTFRDAIDCVLDAAMNTATPSRADAPHAQ